MLIGRTQLVRPCGEEHRTIWFKPDVQTESETAALRHSFTLSLLNSLEEFHLRKEWKQTSGACETLVEEPLASLTYHLATCYRTDRLGDWPVGHDLQALNAIALHNALQSARCLWSSRVSIVETSRSQVLSRGAIDAFGSDNRFDKLIRRPFQISKASNLQIAVQLSVDTPVIPRSPHTVRSYGDG